MFSVKHQYKSMGFIPFQKPRCHASLKFTGWLCAILPSHIWHKTHSANSIDSSALPNLYSLTTSYHLALEHHCLLWRCTLKRSFSLEQDWSYAVCQHTATKKNTRPEQTSCLQLRARPLHPFVLCPQQNQVAYTEFWWSRPFSSSTVPSP